MWMHVSDPQHGQHSLVQSVPKTPKGQAAPLNHGVLSNPGYMFVRPTDNYML
jgi:hypothetical protein